MVYVIYNAQTDINDLITESETSALMRAGELLDLNQVDDGMNYFVYVYNMTEEQYNDSFIVEGDQDESYTLRSFIKSYGVPEIPEFGKETFHNLSPEEQLEVLKFIPDQVILSEIVRRISEYRSYADAIREASDKLRIFV